MMAAEMVPPEAPTLTQVLEDSSLSITAATGARDEEALRELRASLDRLSRYYLLRGDARAREIALQAQLAEDRLRETIAIRVSVPRQFRTAAGVSSA